MIFCGNSPTHLPSAIRRGCRGGRRWCVTSPGSWGRWKISVSSTSRCIPSPIRKGRSPNSRRRGLSSLRGVSIARIMCCSFVLQAERSRSYENISIQRVRPRRWTRRFLVSNPEDKQRRAGGFVGPEKEKGAGRLFFENPATPLTAGRWRRTVPTPNRFRSYKPYTISYTLRGSPPPRTSAKRRDRERRHYPVGRVRDEGVDHDARPAIQSEKSHTGHRHEYEVQRRDRREKVNEAYGLVTAFQPPQDKAERDAPYPAPDKRPVHGRRRERQRRRDP